MPAVPYPFERLPRLDAREAVESRRVARALAARSLDRAGALVTALLGADATLEAGPLERCPAGELASSVVEPLVACILEAESGAPGARIALELDPRIALVIIDRALGGSGGADVPVPVAGLTDAERGVLAYVVARLAAEAGAGWLVTGVVTTRAALAFAIGDAGASVAPHRVAIGEDRGVARVWLGARAEGALALAPAPRLTDALATLPVDVVVEGAIGTLAPDDATALSMGDVVLLENTWVARDAAGGFSGEVRARIDGAARMRMRCSLGSSGLSVIAIDVDASIAATNAKTKGRGMEPDTERQVLDRASDAPIPVSIEIARFSLPLAELSQIQVGEVLVTGKVIGERVALRAGDRVLATGELVDVDGEVGLRILELAP